MNTLIRDTLTHLGATLDDTGIVSTGAPHGDCYTEGHAYCVPLVHLASLRASGPDAADFLQNLLTNDARKLPPGHAELNGFCTPKGRLLASFLMWREGEDYCLSLSADVAEGVAKKLRMYILRSKVTLTQETDTRALVGLSGPAATAALTARGLLPDDAPFAVRVEGDTTVIRLGADRYQLIQSAEAAAALIKALPSEGLTLGATTIWDAQDIAAGLPRISARTQEAFVPQMVNFELLGGVNFKKGCYPGQEIVARTQYLGKLKKRMHRARLTEGQPQPGAPLFGVDLADQACGEIVTAARTAAGFEVLAVVQMSSVQAGPIRLGSTSGPVLEWLSLPYEIT